MLAWTRSPSWTGPRSAPPASRWSSSASPPRWPRSWHGRLLAPDVDPDTRTALVTSGPFRLVRNPIFTATAANAAGLALIVPNLLAVAMLVAFLTALQIQVRLVEEPSLHRVHGTAYERYAAQTGRFLPWIGRHRASTGPA